MENNEKKLNINDINDILSEEDGLVFYDTDDVDVSIEDTNKTNEYKDSIEDLDDEIVELSSNFMSKEELINKYTNIDKNRVENNNNKDTIIKEKNIKKLSYKERKAIKDAIKKDIKENYTGFNKINGYIPDYNIIVNELNDFIIILKCYDFNAIKELIDNMEKYLIKEVEIFSHHHDYYVSLRFINYQKGKKEIDNKALVNELNIINEKIKEITKSDVKFALIKIKDVFKLLREKVYREDIYQDTQIEAIINNKNKSKSEFQKKIFAKNVNIQNDYIEFNKSEDENKKIIKHQVLGLQLYPSYLYEGFMSEINYLKGVQTCTYIKNINTEAVLKNLDLENKESTNRFIAEYLKNNKKIYNTCFFIHIHGTEEEINDTKEKVYRISNKYHVHINDFVKQQRRAYSAFLPLMNNTIRCYRQINNIDGIMPQNDNIVKHFYNKMYYGIEQNSLNKFYFERFTNGIMLSSNDESKNYFIQSERNYIFAKMYLRYEVIDFNNYTKDNIDHKLYEVVSKGKTCNELNTYKKYLLFKMWVYLCVAYNKDIVNIEKNDREALNYAFEKLEEKYLNDDTSYATYVERFSNFIKKTNEKLFKKITRYFNNPNENLKLCFAFLYDILVKTNDTSDKKYIYVYNIEQVVDCLDVLFKYVFNNKTDNLFLFSSSNDFALLNNRYVSVELFNSPYINIYDVQNNDLVKIAEKIYLNNDDIVFLNDKQRITGRLLTNICEFNYYNEKEGNINDI